MDRDRIVEVSRAAAERVADRRAGAPASTKIIRRASELRAKAAVRRWLDNPDVCEALERRPEVAGKTSN